MHQTYKMKIVELSIQFIVTYIRLHLVESTMVVERLTVPSEVRRSTPLPEEAILIDSVSNLSKFMKT